MAPYHPSLPFTNSEFNSVLFTLDPFSPARETSWPCTASFRHQPQRISLYMWCIGWPAARHFSIFFAFYLCTSHSLVSRAQSLRHVAPQSDSLPEKKSLPVIHARSLFLLSLFLYFSFFHPFRWNLIDPRPIDKRTKEPWIRGSVIIRMWCMECGNWINQYS